MNMSQVFLNKPFYYSNQPYTQPSQKMYSYYQPATKPSPAPTKSVHLSSTIEPLPGLMPNQLAFSQVLTLLEEDKVQNVSILENPDPWSGLPSARLRLNNGRTFKVDLPRHTDKLQELLNTKAVPYNFEEKKLEGAERISTAANNILKESLVPILLFGLTSLLGAGVFRYGNRFIEKNRIQAVLQEAVKKYETADKSPSKLLELYPQSVQRVANRFREGRAQGVILIGPPGNGKTHVLESIAKEALQKQDSIALDLSEPEVRSLLSRIYSFDGKDRQNGLKSLNALAKKEVKHILLVVDEFERYWNDLSDLFTKSVSNGSGNKNLPKLHPLLSGNDLPALTEDAAESRIGHLRAFVDHLSPDSLATMVNRIVKNTQHNHGAKPAEHQSLKALFERNPGYSVRRLLDVLNDVLVDSKTSNVRPFPLVEKLEQTLQSPEGFLTGSELAGLVRRSLLEKIKPNLENPQIGAQSLTLYSFKEAENLFRDLGLKLNLNGKKVKQLINQVMPELNLQTMTDDKDFISYLKEISERLPAEGMKIKKQPTAI